MFTTALWRNVGDCPFQNLKQRLLYSLARHIARDRGVFIFPANLVDLIDVDDSLLGTFDVAISSLEEFENDVLNVFSNVPGLRKCCRIDDSEGNTQHTRERLREECLTGAGRTDKKDICFLNFDVRTSATEFDPLIVLIHGDGQALLGFVLTDHVFV